MRRARAGFALLPVVLMIGMLAAVAFLITHDSAMSTQLLRSAADADEVDYVVDAGLEHALWQLEDSGCGGDLTLASTPLGTHSYSARVVAGGTTSTGSLTADRDAWIRNDDPTRNNGTNADQHVRSEGGNIEQALFHFDVSSMPAGTQINSATAWFYVKWNGAHPEGPLTVHRITEDWLESDVTWDSFAGSFDAAPLATIPAQPAGDVWVSVNLGAQVQAWVNGEPNFGILLASSTEGTHAQYISREGAAGQRPRLDVVVGTTPASPASIQVTGTLANGISRTRSLASTPAYQPPSGLALQPGTEGKDSYTWELNPTTNYGNDDETWVAKRTGDSALALFQFDVGAVPPGAKIQSAVLSLHHRSGSGTDVPITAHRITEDWSESSTTWRKRNTWTNWTTPGGDLDASVVATTEVGPASSTRYEWDITPLVQGWASGTWPNRGVALRTDLAGTVGERFDTSDHADPTRHPRLDIFYSCECGVACVAPSGGGTDVMLLVRNPFNPDPSDQLRKAVLEYWGYNVNLVGDETTGFWWDLAISANDVVYVSGTVDPALVGTKLTGETIGVVSEAGALNDELGIAASAASPVGSSIQVSDVSHWITHPFTTGPLALYETHMAGTAVSGSIAPGAQTLASWGGAPGLVALDKGVMTTSGIPTADRRVMLPVGGGESVNWSQLSTDGWVLMHRALQWAGGNTGAPTPGPEIWLSTQGDVNNGGAPGLDDWTEGEALEFGEPDLVLEPGTTDGTFSAVLDLDAFGGDTDIDALHYVDNAITVGSANAVALLPGDVLLSTESGETLTSVNSITVEDKDVFVFRPQAEGDYGTGTFTFLLDGSEIHGDDTTGITLVEKDTVVAGATLSRGSFLMARKGKKEVFEFEPIDVGLDTSSGALTELIVELDIDKDIHGLELAEDAVAIGEHAIPEGAILITLEDDDTDGVGDNAIPVQATDIFYLIVTQLGATPSADAVLLFEGQDVALDENEERLDAFSLKGSVWASADDTGPLAHWKLDDASGGTALDSVGGHDGTLAGPAWTTGTLDGALAFDGSGDYVDLTSDAEIDDVFTSGATVMAWIRPDGWGQNNHGHILDKDDSLTSIGNGWSLELDGVYQNVLLQQGFSTTGGSWFAPKQSIDLGVWQHVAVSYDSSDSANVPTLYLDGVAQALATASAPTGSALSDAALGLRLGNHSQSTTRTFDGGIDDARIYDRILDASEIADIAAEGDGGGGGGGGGAPSDPAYVEANEPWTATSEGDWETVDLSPYGVPANAVVEVAVENSKKDKERWGGLRAVGSTLERRLQLHEAESGGLDVVVMHVQADASSRIQHYAEKDNEVGFTLLGYWTGAAYEERFQPFKAGGNGLQKHALSSHGVDPGHVVEIAISNTSDSSEYQGGVQSSGADLGRVLDLHEAEGGGVDAATMMVTASLDDSAVIVVYAESNANIQFHLLGVWTTPPGSYTEAFAPLGNPGSSASWADRDLTGEGVPTNAVTQIAISNREDEKHAPLGVREKPGASPLRTLDLHEAQAGGDDVATLHVNADDASVIRWYDAAAGDTHEFTLLGWWVLFTTD